MSSDGNGLVTGVVVALMLAAAPVQGQQTSVHGQLRPRHELYDRGGGMGSSAFTSMRVRAAIQALLDDRVSAYVELQDVRVWGEEASTLTDFRADNLDLHQGYVGVGLGVDGWLRAQAGRQETNLGGQRLVGAVGWTQQGRSFDGVRLTATRERGTVDLLAYTLSESDGTPRSVDGDLLGIYATADLTAGTALDLYGLLDRMSGATDTRQGTLGARLHGSRGPYAYRGEVSVQRGRRLGDDVSAYMFGVRAGRSLLEGRTTLTLWYDYLSGDDDPGDGKIRVFDTLFATNHKFYGLADVFLNIPLHTGGQGLQDMALKASHRVSDRVGLAVDGHVFRVAKRLTGRSASLGREIDVTLDYRHTDQLGVVAGISRVSVDDGLRAIGNLTDDLTFSYLMLDVRF